MSQIINLWPVIRFVRLNASVCCVNMNYSSGCVNGFLLTLEQICFRLLATVSAGLSHWNTWHFNTRVFLSRATYAKSLKHTTEKLHIEFVKQESVEFPLNVCVNKPDYHSDMQTETCSQFTSVLLTCLAWFSLKTEFWAHRTENHSRKPWVHSLWQVFPNGVC